ncbi:LamG-like jellyroll fold domain-containing protein [Streptomyces sp. NPDC060028]|uniref:LamG domain-containing protein n=1 Tax=Streptomyces sp. NPDC060028 TaxID=3347041 RepID=UPI003683A0D7
MTEGTDRPHNPQPDPATGNGGYGYPQGQIPGGGYGYPQSGQPNPYPPQPGAPGQAGAFGEPEGPGFGEPAGFGQPTGFGDPAPLQEPAFTPPPQPDWQALADRSESQRSRRKMLTLIGGAVAVVLAAGAGYLVFTGGSNDKPQDNKPTTAASGSASPSQGGEDTSPTVAGEPTLLRDRANAGPPVQLSMSPDVELAKMGERNEVRFKGGPNSFAQGAEPAVDVTKSFTVTTRIYSVTETGSRMAISQGDGDSYSFEMGFEVVSGKKSWVFRVQTGDKGAAATAQQVVVEAPDALKKWTQLTGTYDAEKKTIALYVNDKPAGTAQVGGIWAGPGPVQLGRARHHGIWSGSFVGSLDRIRIWNKTLSPEQVAVLDSGKLDKLGKPTHAWLI